MRGKCQLNQTLGMIQTSKQNVHIMTTSHLIACHHQHHLPPWWQTGWQRGGREFLIELQWEFAEMLFKPDPSFCMKNKLLLVFGSVLLRFVERQQSLLVMVVWRSLSNVQDGAVSRIWFVHLSQISLCFILSLSVCVCVQATANDVFNKNSKGQIVR